MANRGRLTLQGLGEDWPHRESSRLVDAGGISWHLQQMGQGPSVLMIHGTGSSCHTWRDVMPALAKNHTVLAPDLPGHGATESPGRSRLSLSGMSRLLSALLKSEGIEPDYVVGHSAGAAIAIWMSLEGLIRPKCIVSINGALMPFKGSAGVLFPSIARLLFVNPIAPRLFAGRADTGSITKLIELTGSHLTPEGIEYYRRLIRNPAHTGAVLGMMANWSLHPLLRLLDRLDVPLHLIAAEQDRSVPPNTADQIAQIVRSASVHHVAGLGHLAHEEAPALFATLILESIDGKVHCAGN